MFLGKLSAPFFRRLCDIDMEFMRPDKIPAGGNRKNDEEVFMRTLLLIRGKLAVIAASLFLLTAGGGSLFSQTSTSYQLFFTSDVYGYLKPCG